MSAECDGISLAGHEPRELTDDLRGKCPVVRNDRGEYVLLRHDDVVAAASDDKVFSSAVSAFLQIPNGLDGEEHTVYRAALDPFLTAEALQPYLTDFASAAEAIIEDLPRGKPIDAVSDFGARFAARAQSSWLGWDPALEDTLVDWVAQNQAATQSGDRDRMAQVAADFDALIHAIVADRRDGDDVTSQLLQTTVNGRTLSQPQVVSVLRNWTGGDLGSIALCIGVIVHHLARDTGLQQRLRAGVDDETFDAVIDEILRIDDPFVSNRRVTTDSVELAGVMIPAGSRVHLHWTSANRDEAVFGDPDEFQPRKNSAHNLVYGTGRHVCPGRLLATVELRIASKALLAATSAVRLGGEGIRETHPVGGWVELPVVLT